MPRHRPALLLAALAAALLVVPATTGTAATRTPTAPKIKTRNAKVQIDVRGYLEIRRLHDTTSDCFPGESWTQVNRYDYATGGFRNINLKRVTGEGFDPVVTSTPSAPAGTAKVEGKILGYRTTNYCTGTKAEVKPEPTCAPVRRGRTRISLLETTPSSSTDDDELTPLSSGNRLQVAVFMTGSGFDDPDCVGGGPESLTGDALPTSIATTAIAPGNTTALPAGITTLKLFGIRRGQTIRRTAIVTGPCTRAEVDVVTGAGGSPSPARLNADGDCQVAGKLSYTIRPRPVKK